MTPTFCQPLYASLFVWYIVEGPYIQYQNHQCPKGDLVVGLAAEGSLHLVGRQCGWCLLMVVG